MKMKNFLFGAFITGAALFLASCDKEVESTDLKVDLARTITVKGYVYAEMDKTKNGLEFAPAGTVIRLSVNYNQLAGAVGTGKWVDTVAVDANGTFTAEVPVDDDGVILKVDPIEFEGTLIKSFGSNPAQVKAIYSGAVSNPAPPTNVVISTTINKIIEITYIPTELSAGQEEFVKVQFTANAIFSEEKGTYEKVSGVSLSVYSDGWATTVSQVVNGVFTIDIPKSTDLNFEFTANKTVYNSDGVLESQLYLYKAVSAVGGYTFKQKATLDFGGGIPTIE